MINKKRNNIILISFIVVAFILVSGFICYDIFKADDSNNKHFVNKENSNDDNVKVDEGLDTEVFFNDESDDNVQSSVNDVSISKNDSSMDDTPNDNEYKENNDIEYKENNNIEYKEDVDSEFNENNIVEYFQDIENEVLESNTFKEKFKEYFILIIDFIFYEGEINGYKFNELSNSAKIKIISFALKIDSKIEKYIPNYKESISSTSNRIYTDVKGKLVSAYMDISSEICKNNDSECRKVKEIFGEIKDYCKIGWDFIKELFNNGTYKVREWYEIYSGK